MTSGTRSRKPLTIVHTEASNGWGGQEIRILAEAAGLRARGHDVALCCAPGARIAQEASRYGVPLQVLPIGRKRPGGVLALRRRLHEANVDVVNTHSSTDSWLAALACCTLHGAPALVRTRHVSVPLADNAATRWLYRRATTRIVTTGEALRLQLVRDNGIDPDRIDSVPTGIDPARFGKMNALAARVACNLPKDVPLVGIVATLRSWKGHRYLVDAFPRLRHVNAQLVVVGDGPQREALHAQVAAANLGSRVTFAGDQRDVAPWLAALDVFALPSYANEGVPQAMLQAMCAGVPVVTTDAGAIPELARADETALVVPREDAAALAQAIDRLLDDRALGRRRADAARAHVLAHRTETAMLDRMEALFYRAVAERGTGAGRR